jgi:hypothetical protein
VISFLTADPERGDGAAAGAPTPATPTTPDPDPVATASPSRSGSPRRGRWIALAGLAALLLLALGAGSVLWLRPGPTATSAAAPGAATATTPNQTGSGPGASSQSGDASDSGSTAPGPTALGGSASFSDGLAVSVGVPADYTPSSTASIMSGPPGVRMFVMSVTIHNNSRKVFEPTAMLITSSVNGQEANEVVDPANGIVGPPPTSVQPGHTTTYRIVFSAPLAHGDLQVDVTPTGAAGPATFTGTL